MANKLQFQRIRPNNGRRPNGPEDQKPRQTVFEPVDIVLLVVILLVVFWLQWLMGAMAA